MARGGFWIEFDRFWGRFWVLVTFGRFWGTSYPPKATRRFDDGWRGRFWGTSYPPKATRRCSLVFVRRLPVNLGEQRHSREGNPRMQVGAVASLMGFGAVASLMGFGAVASLMGFGGRLVDFGVDFEFVTRRV